MMRVSMNILCCEWYQISQRKGLSRNMSKALIVLVGPIWRELQMWKVLFKSYEEGYQQCSRAKWNRSFCSIRPLGTIWREDLLRTYPLPSFESLETVAKLIAIFRTVWKFLEKIWLAKRNERWSCLEMSASVFFFTSIFFLKGLRWSPCLTKLRGFFDLLHCKCFSSALEQKFKISDLDMATSITDIAILNVSEVQTNFQRRVHEC